MNKFGEQNSVDWFLDFKWLKIAQKFERRDIGRNSIDGIARKRAKSTKAEKKNLNQPPNNEGQSTNRASRGTCYEYIHESKIRGMTPVEQEGIASWNSNRIEQISNNEKYIENGALKALNSGRNVNRKLRAIKEFEVEDAAADNEHLTAEYHVENSKKGFLTEAQVDDNDKQTENKGNEMEDKGEWMGNKCKRAKDKGEQVEEIPLDTEADSSNKETISWSEESEDDSYDNELLNCTEK